MRVNKGVVDSCRAAFPGQEEMIKVRGEINQIVNRKFSSGLVRIEFIGGSILQIGSNHKLKLPLTVHA